MRSIKISSLVTLLLLVSELLCLMEAFTTQRWLASRTQKVQIPGYAYVSSTRFMSEPRRTDGIVELADDDDEADSTSQPIASKAAAPFLSQGEILQESLNPDLSDPKQARVIVYIVLSLLPVLFLIPFMLGSRDLIPLDDLPPVQL
jgi:hypothetical protein